jgi:hypothetical protein
VLDLGRYVFCGLLNHLYLHSNWLNGLVQNMVYYVFGIECYYSSVLLWLLNNVMSVLLDVVV